jgi:hypothetical protein
MRLPVGIRQGRQAVVRQPGGCVRTGSPLALCRQVTMRAAIREASPGSGANAAATGGMIRAVVIHGATATPYSRAGSGSPLVMLVDDEALAAALFRGLVDCFRVIAPEPPPHLASADARTGSASAVWLTGFVEGLGLDRFSVVADWWWREGLLGLASSAPERIAGTVYLLNDARDRAASEANLANEFFPEAPPSMLASIDGTPDPLLVTEAVMCVRRFLVAEYG